MATVEERLAFVEGRLQELAGDTPSFGRTSETCGSTSSTWTRRWTGSGKS
jgi:hypothetical protein